MILGIVDSVTLFLNVPRRTVSYWHGITHLSLKFIDELWTCRNKYTNVYLNGNLAQIPVIQTEVLLSPKKKKATFPLASTLFCFVSNIAVCIFLLRGGCKQSNSLTTTRENINIFNIFKNVTYLNMFHICIYRIYNMIPLLCTKVNFI